MPLSIYLRKVRDEPLGIRAAVMTVDRGGFDRILPDDNQQDSITRMAKIPQNITTKTPSSIYSRVERGCLLFISAIISPATSGWVATWLVALTWLVGKSSGIDLTASELSI